MTEQIENSAQEPQMVINAESVPEDRWHVVQPGENLTAIAKAYYGAEHAAHWITLYNFNREIIGDDPDLIQVGMEILIPDISQFL